jgi:hypothetical protein
MKLFKESFSWINHLSAVSQRKFQKLNKPLANPKPSVQELSTSSDIAVLLKGNSFLQHVSLGPSQGEIPWLQVQSRHITK